MVGFPDSRFQGVISVAYEKGYEFTPEVRERVAQVADTAALLISRARLYEETQRRADLLEKLAGQITTLTSDLNRCPSRMQRAVPCESPLLPRD